MKKKELFAVGSIQKKREIDLGGIRLPLEMSWAKGMIGVMPVFDNIEDAHTYADENEMVISIYIEDKEV